MGIYDKVKRSSSCEFLASGYEHAIDRGVVVVGSGFQSLYFSAHNVINTHTDSELLLLLRNSSLSGVTNNTAEELFLYRWQL